MAEGEELGSNLLHVAQRSSGYPDGSGSLEMGRRPELSEASPSLSGAIKIIAGAIKEGNSRWCRPLRHREQKSLVARPSFDLGATVIPIDKRRVFVRRNGCVIVPRDFPDTA